MGNVTNKGFICIFWNKTPTILKKELKRSYNKAFVLNCNCIHLVTALCCFYTQWLLSVLSNWRSWVETQCSYCYLLSIVPKTKVPQHCFETLNSKAIFVDLAGKSWHCKCKLSSPCVEHETMGESKQAGHPVCVCRSQSMHLYVNSCLFFSFLPSPWVSCYAGKGNRYMLSNEMKTETNKAHGHHC